MIKYEPPPTQLMINMYVGVNISYVAGSSL